MRRLNLRLQRYLLTTRSKKIYFDGFLPPAKLDIRLQRLQNSTHQLTQFHQSNNEPCRSAFPQPDATPLSLFQSTTVRSSLTALPALSFVVPAILEGLKSSSRYADLTEVVSGEADLYCARYLKQHGGVVFTSDSDLLVHDLGAKGAVSFFSDIESGGDASTVLRSQIFQPAAISNRLALPESHGLRALAYEIVMDAHGTFPKLVKQAKDVKAITEHRQMYDDFLKEYNSLPIESETPTEYSATIRVLQYLDPRTSEYVLHFASLATIAGQQMVSKGSASPSPHIFLSFLLDCPVRTNAWEVSTATRQLAYGLINIIVPVSEQATSVFEHRRQIERSAGRELMLPEVSDVPEACIAVLETFEDLKKKLPNFTQTQLWMAFAVHQDIEWSTANSKTAISQLFLQRMAYPKIADRSGYFGWDIVQFFAQLQGSLYSFRILQQLTCLVVSTGPKDSIPEAIHRLNSLLSSVPPLVKYPDLGTASSIVRKSEGLKFLKDLKEVMKVLDHPPSAPALGPTKSEKSSKKKRKREQAVSESPAGKAKSSNPFTLLETN